VILILFAVGDRNSEVTIQFLSKALHPEIICELPQDTLDVIHQPAEEIINICSENVNADEGASMRIIPMKRQHCHFHCSNELLIFKHCF